MAIRFLIGGVDYTNYVDLKSVKITSNIAVSSDNATFDILIPEKSISRPKGGQEIVILNGDIKEFGGVVLNPKERMIAPDQMLYSIKCRDYTYWFDKRVVVNTYDSYNAGNIVKNIVQNFTSGFTTNNVLGTSASFFIAQKKFDHIYPSKCMQELSAAVGFQWWIDYDRDVHFGPLMLNPSPLPNNLLLPDSYTVDSETGLSYYSNLELEEDVSQLRNQIYLLGYKVPTIYQITQKFVCDGQTNTFYTTYEPKHLLKDITVTLDGATQDKALDIAGGLPNSQMADGKVYIYYKNMSYRFNNSPSQGNILSITYYPMFEQVNMYNDPNSFQLMKQRDLQDGVYEYAVRDPQLTSIDGSLANTRGQLELYKYAYPHYTGQFDSFTQGWQPGQYFYLTSDNRMDGQFQKQVFYVIKVDKTILNHPLNETATLRYTVYISDTPYSY